MRCAVIDTNVFLHSYLKKLDIFTQLKEMGFVKFYVPSKVVDELKRIKSGKELFASKFALNLIEKFCEVVDVDARGTDTALIELAISKGCVLITNDKELKRLARKRGIVVGYIRGFKGIEIVE